MNYVKSLLVALMILLVSPLTSFAVYNDVTLTTDTVITIGGVSLNVSGSSASVESITVNTNTFSVDLLSGSSIKVTSADKKEMTTDTSSTYVSTNTCNDSESTLGLSSSAGTVTVIVSLTGRTCSASSTATNAGGAAPGTIILDLPEPRLQKILPDGTIIYLDEITDENAPMSVPEEAKPKTTILVASTDVIFNKNLKFGMINEDVRRLQKAFNMDPATMVARSGVGSSGKETNIFGNLTREAVKKFQIKYGIVSSGDENTTGFGFVGPKTRQKIAEVYNPTSPNFFLPPPPATSQQKQQQIKTLKAQIKTLQSQLADLLDALIKQMQAELGA